MFKVNIKDTSRHQIHRSGVFVGNFEHTPFFGVSIADFVQVNVCWEITCSTEYIFDFAIQCPCNL